MCEERVAGKGPLSLGLFSFILKLTAPKVHFLISDTLLFSRFNPNTLFCFSAAVFFTSLQKVKSEGACGASMEAQGKAVSGGVRFLC